MEKELLHEGMGVWVTHPQTIAYFKSNPLRLLYQSTVLIIEILKNHKKHREKEKSPRMPSLWGNNEVVNVLLMILFHAF